MVITDDFGAPWTWCVVDENDIAAEMPATWLFGRVTFDRPGRRGLPRTLTFGDAIPATITTVERNKHGVPERLHSREDGNGSVRTFTFYDDDVGWSCGAASLLVGARFSRETWPLRGIYVRP